MMHRDAAYVKTTACMCQCSVMSVCDVRMCKCLRECVCLCVSQSSCYVGASSGVKLKLCAGGSYNGGVTTSENGTDSQVRLGRVPGHADENKSLQRELVYCSRLEKSCHGLVTVKLHSYLYFPATLYFHSTTIV